MPGVVARKSSNSWSILPIRKRYSMLYHRAPLHPRRSFSNENESKTKDSGLNLKKANPNTSSGALRNVEDLVKPALAKKLAGQEAIGTTKVSVVVAKQGESHNKFELHADSGHVELSFGSKKPHVSSLVDPNTKESCLMRGTVNPSLLSLAKVDSRRVSPNSSLLKNLASNRKMNSPTCKTVMSEDVIKTLVQANAGNAVLPVGTFKATVVKTKVVRQNLQSIIELSSKELLEQKPVKCEPIQEINLEISDVIAPQSVGRVLQRKDEECSILSTPSDHTNEANRSKNARDQANADIAAKNANSDLKEVNVEALVSTSMNIEDHTVYKMTQDTHDLVASGEGSGKISISAGTQEECYVSDYHRAFVGHVDTVSEDEEYEDGEIREPMIVEGIDSGENNESSSKKVHTESYDDVVMKRVL